MEYVLTALAFGLSATLNPGPFTALVIAETLAGGWQRGLRAALAPLLTDGAMILVGLTILARLPDPAVATVEIAGGLVLLYMGYGTVASACSSLTVAEVSATGGSTWAPLWRAVSVNSLNPNAWLFWLTAGTPSLRQAAAAGSGWAAAFLLTFFACLCGGMALLAAGVAAGRHLLGGRGHRLLLAAMGLVLAALGLRAAWLGVRLLWPA